MPQTARISASLPGRQSVSQSAQDYGNISGAVMANKKLSVILNREKNTEGGQTSMAGSGRVFGIVNNGFSVRGWDIRGEKLLVGGMWWAKVIHARTLYHVHTDKAAQTHD